MAVGVVSYILEVVFYSGLVTLTSSSYSSPCFPYSSETYIFLLLINTII